MGTVTVLRDGIARNVAVCWVRTGSSWNQRELLLAGSAVGSIATDANSNGEIVGAMLLPTPDGQAQCSAALWDGELAVDPSTTTPQLIFCPSGWFCSDGFHSSIASAIGQPASITGATDVALEFYHTVVVADAVCAAELNGGRVVDGLDLIAVLVVWGTTGDGLPADFNRSGIVDGGDLSFVTSGWGACAD